MAHFAQIDDNDIVTRVLVIDQDEIDTGNWGDPASWLKTSYNTRGGIYYTPNSNPPTPDPDQSKAFRKNFAGIGYTYDLSRDAFIPPKPAGMDSFMLDDFSCEWKPPIPKPDVAPSPGYEWLWDEATMSWIEEPSGGFAIEGQG